MWLFIFIGIESSMYTPQRQDGPYGDGSGDYNDGSFKTSEGGRLFNNGLYEVNSFEGDFAHRVALTVTKRTPKLKVSFLGSDDEIIEQIGKLLKGLDNLSDNFSLFINKDQTNAPLQLISTVIAEDGTTTENLDLKRSEPLSYLKKGWLKLRKNEDPKNVGEIEFDKDSSQENLIEIKKE